MVGLRSRVRTDGLEGLLELQDGVRARDAHFMQVKDLLV